MKISDRGAAFIAAHEGVVTKAYRDVAGIWTIGVGHTASAGPPKPVAGMTITRDEAFKILADDIAKVFEPRVRKALGDVPQHVFDGAVSFDFNTGGVDRASWVAAYKRGDMAAAERSLKLWNKAGGRAVAGLVRRRGEEADLIFRGRYGAAAAAASAPSVSTSSDDVADYQRQLAALGVDPGPIDGIRGAKTKAAVEAFQKAMGLFVDGIVGPATRAALQRAGEKVEAAPVSAPTQPAPGEPIEGEGDDDWEIADHEDDHMPPAPEAAGIAGPVLVFAGIVIAVLVAAFLISRPG